MKWPGIILFITWMAPIELRAQKLSPKWYGRAETKTRSSYNSYLCEIIITKKGNQVSGTLNYFFGHQEHTVKISGIYWPQSKTIELNPFNLITHFATDQNSPDCQVDGSLTLYTDKGDSILYGQLNPVGKYRNMCPILTISLQKEIISDPEPDPDLPIPPDVKLNDSLSDGAGNVISSGVISVSSVDSTGKNSVIELNKEQPAGAEVGKSTSNVPVTEKAVAQPEFIKRNFEKGPLIESGSDTILLHLYDNGQVDNDTVSVYFNRAVVLQKQKLGLTPIVLRLVLRPGENEIAMFAENLGNIPPNTALCLIFAGDKRYDINLVSTLASNGTVRIERRKDLPGK